MVFTNESPLSIRYERTRVSFIIEQLKIHLKIIFYQKTFCKDNQKQKNRTSKFPRGVMMQTKEERKEDLEQQCLLSDHSINANYQIISIVCLAAV